MPDSPSVYIVPSGDGDDVSGHAARNQDVHSPTGDVKGHLVRKNADSGDDDVEGHVIARDQAANAHTDDVRGR